MTKAPWILTVLLFACDVSSLAAQERWLELTSDHYRVLGNVEERDLEETAARFEAFHSAVSEMFSPRQYPDLRPTTVVVFDDDDGLEVLGLEGREGYFFADAREHYVAMRTESNGRRPFDALLHDYFHAIAEESIPNAPLWLKEGLAEFYRTAIWSDDGSQLQIGRPIDAFIRSVREDGTRLSFDELTAVGRDSNLYDEIGRDDVFHAQSWAFVHYLITLNQGQGYGQTIRFVRLVASGDGFEQAVEDAFGANFRTVLAGFENNVQERGTYPYLTLRAVDSARGIGQSRPEVMSEAEVEAELSGLLMRRGAADEAELRLREALAVSPNAVAPMRMLARLLIDQGQFDEARLSLESGLGPSGFDAPTNYFYALAILGDGSRIDDSRLDLARAALRDAIRLDPEFADAHHELALTYLLPSARDEGLDEAVELVDHALELKPRNHEYRFSLVRILIEQERFTDARTALLPLVDEIQAPENRNRALAVLQSIEGLEGSSGIRGDGFTEITRDATAREDVEPSFTPEDSSAANIAFDRFELTRIVTGQQLSGFLSLIDCREGLTLTVESDPDTYLFHTDNPDRVEFATFTPDVGSEVRCGPLDPPVPVVITFDQAPEGSEFIGVPNKIEFVAAP